MSRNERRRAAALNAALARLPERQRAVFRAVAVDGASYIGAAERLRMNAAEVEQHLAAALVALDRALAPTLRQTVWQRLAARIVPRPDG